MKISVKCWKYLFLYSKILKNYCGIVCICLDRCSEKKLLQVTGTYVITNDLLSCSALEAFDCRPYVYHLVLDGGGGGSMPPPPSPQATWFPTLR